MADKDPRSQILSTKLYRPPVTADYTPRNALETRLEAGIELPLTLVCAPAGYGKSTTVSRWLETCSLNSAWLSLDTSDSDLRNFLTYVISAVQTIDADSCRQTQYTLAADRLPEVAAITICLSNDFEALKERLVLVLDDFHRISDPSVHSILDSLLAHPLHNLHLVIVSRRDPLLSLATLRARHLLNEIRMLDLKFSDEETGTFVRASTNQPITTRLITELQNKTEGWPVGLRLATLALQGQQNVDEFLSRFGADTRPLQEYLIHEVLYSLSPEVRDRLVYTAILDRFNASLCEFVWDSELSALPVPQEGRKFIDNLVNTGIFCIALDEGSEWYRFHHLFQSLLGQQLLESVGAEKVSKLHQRASHWFFEHHYFEDAIHHALAAGDHELAIEVIGQARHDLLNTDQWYRLQAWLKSFSPQIIQQQPHLLLSQCWLDLFLTYRLDLLPLNVERVATLLKDSDPNAPKLEQLKAELMCLQAVVAYTTSEGNRCVTLAQLSLRGSPIIQECVRSTAYWIQIMAQQMQGKVNHAEKLAWHTLGSGELRTPAGRARVWTGMAFNAWCEADTQKFHEAATQLNKLSAEHEMLSATASSRYFLGLIHYESNKLSDANREFEVIASHPDRYSAARVVDCMILLCLSHQALGNNQLARDYLKQVSTYVLEHSAGLFLGLIQALRAEIDLRQGNIASANQWANTYTLPPHHNMHRYYQAEFVAAKIHLAADTPESRSAAGKVLDYLHDLVGKVHHKRFLIDVLVLKSWRAYLESDEALAVALLGEAFELGKPGRLIRPFVDLVPEMISLLNRLDLDAEGLEYLGAILAALPRTDGGALADKPSLPEVLSQRELEILELLAKGQSNKAIAEKLFISMGTVKRHAHNIFNKLGVKDRRSAVSKAIGLGILTK
ncbi:MAG: LuxR C-terminal-related transcriptional regulator [Halioglobus sp.]